MSPEPMPRRRAVALLTANRGDALVVSGLGSPTWDVYAAGDHDANFYLWGAMGGAALVGLGLALARPDRRVVVVTGDGEQLMAVGGLATIGVAGPANLDVFVLDNEHYGETGMQQSHTARGVDLAALARASGFTDTAVVHSLEQLEALVDRIGVGDDEGGAAAGPRLYVLKVGTDDVPRALPPRDAVWLKNRFRAHLGLSPN